MWLLVHAINPILPGLVHVWSILDDLLDIEERVIVELDIFIEELC